MLSASCRDPRIRVTQASMPEGKTCPLVVCVTREKARVCADWLAVEWVGGWEVSLFSARAAKIGRTKRFGWIDWQGRGEGGGGGGGGGLGWVCGCAGAPFPSLSLTHSLSHRSLFAFVSYSKSTTTTHTHINTTPHLPASPLLSRSFLSPKKRTHIPPPK